MRPRLPASLVVFLLAAPAAAQPRTHDVTIDDYFTLATITQFAVSPDGEHVAYCDARWQQSTDDRKADLWVVPTDGKGKPTRLTSERANERHPRWAADSKAVYVLANRKREAEKKPPYDGSTQVWRVPLNGGEPQAVTRVEGGVSGFDYAAKADELFYSVDATATDEDAFTKLRTTYKADYGHGTRKVSEVYRLDLDTWRAEKVIAEKNAENKELREQIADMRSDREHMRKHTGALAEALGEAAKKPAPAAVATATARGDGNANTDSKSNTVTETTHSSTLGEERRVTRRTIPAPVPTANKPAPKKPQCEPAPEPKPEVVKLKSTEATLEPADTKPECEPAKTVEP